MSEVWIWGWHAVESIFKTNNRRIFRVLMTAEQVSRAQKSLFCYKDKSIEKLVEIVPKQKMNQAFGQNHQSIAVLVSDLNFWNLDDWIKKHENAKQKQLLVACDLIEDPHNLGAIIRTAAAFNAHGILVTKMKCAPFEGALAKSAAGALELIPIIKVANLATALRVLQENNYYVFGLDEGGQRDWHSDKKSLWSRSERAIIALGQEGQGLRDLTKKTCDAILSINTSKEFSTLNVSVAAGIAISRFLDA